MQIKRFCLINKNVDFKSFVVRVKRMSDLVFEPSSVQSRQFQALVPLTIMPVQHMSLLDLYQLLNLAFDK